MLIQIYGWSLSTTGQGAQTQEELAQALREMRDVLLKESDWTQMLDCPLSEEIKNDWRIWRQAMRDITSTVSYPLENTLELPVTPESGRPLSWDNWDLNSGVDEAEIEIVVIDEIPYETISGAITAQPAAVDGE